MPEQEIISIDPKPENSIHTFVYPHGCDSLKSFLSEARIQNPVLVWGAPGCGCSHLLQAIHIQAQEQGIASCYVDAGPEAMEQLETRNMSGLQLLCLDNVDQVDTAVETMLVGTLDACRAKDVRLLLAVHENWDQSINLPDLRTRLTSYDRYHLADLDDTLRREALLKRADYFSMKMPDEVVDYLLTRYQRDNHALFGHFARLGVASLKHKRMLSIPFVRQILG